MSGPVKTADGRVLDAVEVAALDSIAKRLSWASLHWGTEAVSSEAWPHIAIAAAAAVREQIAAEIDDFEPSDPHTRRLADWKDGLEWAARIARGTR